MSVRTRSPTTRVATLAAGLTLWCAAIFSTLQLHTLDLPLGHGICGPWGCAAEPEALVGYHAFWTVLLVPLVALICRVDAGPAGVRLAWTLGLIGALGIAILFSVGSVTWARSEGSRYAVQKGLFDVATQTDLPVIPLTLAGLVGIASAGAAHRPDENEPRAVDPARPGREN